MVPTGQLRMAGWLHDPFRALPRRLRHAEEDAEAIGQVVQEFPRGFEFDNRVKATQVSAQHVHAALKRKPSLSVLCTPDSLH